MIRALVFDFDGLILDTETPEYESWCEVYEKHGGTLSLSVWCQSIGLGAGAIRFDPYADLEAQTGRVLDRAALRVVRRARFAELVAREPVRPGVREYLNDARRLGYACAVASSSDCAWVTGHLARMGLDNYFAAVCCADHVQHTKPHPELYFAALHALGARPQEAVAFEDSPNGIAAAKAAGLFCVAVPNSLTRNLDLGAANCRLDSLADVPLSVLLEQVTPVR